MPWMWTVALPNFPNRLETPMREAITEFGSLASCGRIFSEKNSAVSHVPIGPNVGNHSLPLPLDIGIGHSLAYETDPNIVAGLNQLQMPLYMPALVALRYEPHLRAFYQRLLSRGKAPLQAVVAVMRKLLHALFAMFRSNESYDGSKLCPIELTNKAAA
jgi:hypothetical protein